MSAVGADDSSSEHRGVPCVGCSLICDDLDILSTRVGIEANGKACTRARNFYRSVSDESADPGGAACIGAESVTMEQALDRGAEILAEANLPLVAGLDTDVAGVRAALRVAERCGAVVDPIDSDALFRNVRVMQTEGWLATTLGEARNRADLLVICGSSPITQFPRLLERLLTPAVPLFGENQRRDLYLLSPHREPPPPVPGHCVPTLVTVNPEGLADLAGVLRGRLDGQQPAPRSPQGIDEALLERLLAQLRQARYPVLAWAAAEFDFPHGDLTVQRLVELAGTLSKQTRCTTLALSRASSATTATQVSGWYCGFPPRVSFARGAPDYDPHRYSSTRMLARGEADALLWIAGMDIEAPPPSAPIPRIVLSSKRPSLDDNDVFVRIGIPGIDHGGQLFRGDGVPLSLRKLRETTLPSAASILEAIRERCP